MLVGRSIVVDKSVVDGDGMWIDDDEKQDDWLATCSLILISSLIFSCSPGGQALQALKKWEVE